MNKINQIKNIIRHPMTNKIAETGYELGFRFCMFYGAFYGLFNGMSIATNNIKNQKYDRPKFINPSVYFYGNLLILPVTGCAIGIIGGAAAGSIFPVSIPLIYFLNKNK